MSFSPTHPIEHASFTVDAVVFDMDGTLVDSIAAVESAWGSVAIELNRDPAEVIAATHGRRAIDNLRDLKPRLRRLTNDQMEEHVEKFEKRILFEADEFGERVRSRRSSNAGSSAVSRRGSSSLLAGHGGVFSLSKIATPVEHDSPNIVALDTTGLTDRLANLASPFDDEEDEDEDLSQYTEEEIGCTNKSVKILPGVARIMSSIPQDRLAIATSGAKTHCHGALARAGIQRPKITITADDPRLKRGKPFPDPFILAATELGYDIKKSLVFEDSPSGIIAGVASGACTIAVATSHPVEKISHCGAHYIVPSLDCVNVSVNSDGTLKVTIDAHPPSHPNFGKIGLHQLYDSSAVAA